MTLHSFNPDVAKLVGVNAAVIYQNILFWTQKNLANGRHMHEGKVWTYNSVKAWEELFPYLSGNQIRTALAKLVDADLVYEGNFNEMKIDRTKWYGVLTELHLGKITNGIGKNHRPIPDSKPYIKHSSFPREATNQSEWDKFWSLYPNKVGKPVAQKAFSKALKTACFAEIMHGLERYVHKIDDRPWCNPATWLNQHRWADQPATQPKRQSPRDTSRMEAVNRFLERNEHEQRSSQGSQLDDVINATAKQLER